MRGARVGAVALFATFLLWPATAAAETDWLKLRTLNIAHQGGEDEAPSNTMYAYERALRLGADMLEVDIHTTADSRLVVMHDATVDRTTNGSGRVYDMSLKRVQRLDAGYNLVPGEGTEAGRPAADYVYRGGRTGRRAPPPGFRPRDFRIPTLGEVMRAYPDVPINIEIKGAADADVSSFMRNAEVLAAFLNRLGRRDGIIVVSFNDAALRRFHQLAPQIDLAAPTAAVAAYEFANVRPPDGTVAFQVPTEFEGVTVADEEFIQRAHDDGYGVHVWTINDEQTMRRLLDWRTDGIMTAEPIRLERVLCHAEVRRPRRPDSAAGEHCSPRASIACEVDPLRAERRGEGVRIVLRRGDQFSGRCAGQVVLRVPGSRAAAHGRFSFGKRPPSDGGPRSHAVSLELSPGLRRTAVTGAMVRVATHPYAAFVDRTRLRLG